MVLLQKHPKTVLRSVKDVYVTNCYFHIFSCHFTLKCTFFSNQQFLMFSENLPRIFNSIEKIIFLCFFKLYIYIYIYYIYIL